jgi:hypothetical protein
MLPCRRSGRRRRSNGSSESQKAVKGSSRRNEWGMTVQLRGLHPTRKTNGKPGGEGGFVCSVIIDSEWFVSLTDCAECGKVPV